MSPFGHASAGVKMEPGTPVTPVMLDLEVV